MYDKDLVRNSFQSGEKAWYYKPLRRKGLNPKLQRPWIGHAEISGKINDVLYRIKADSKQTPKIVHHNKLKAYKEDNLPVVE